jgi:hypothetical protein
LQDGGGVNGILQVHRLIPRRFDFIDQNGKQKSLTALLIDVGELGLNGSCVVFQGPVGLRVAATDFDADGGRQERQVRQEG